VRRPSKLLPVAAILVVSGCATVPSGPSVMVLPGAHKSFEEFRADEGVCQQYARDTVGLATPGQAAADSATASAVTGTVVGAAAGALIGAASGNAGAGAAIGAGSGLLLGSAAGSGAAGFSASEVQRRYNIAYMQCMYAKGNQIPAPAGSRGPSARYHSSYPPPPPPGSSSPGDYSAPPGAYPPPPPPG
jgi:OmpA family protein